MLEQTAQTLDSDLDIISQIKLNFANPLPLLIGGLIGASVPLATYTVGHQELGAAGWLSIPGAIVVGGCLFSAITVYKWGSRAFANAYKALGFVVLSEGVMTFSQTHWLSLVMLGLLVAINAVANGSNLTLQYLDSERRRALRALERSVPVIAAGPVAPVARAPEVAPSPKKAPLRKRAAKSRARTAERAATSKPLALLN